MQRERGLERETEGQTDGGELRMTFPTVYLYIMYLSHYYNFKAMLVVLSLLHQRPP